MENPASWLPFLLGIAWLTPLASFTAIVLFGKHMGPHGKYAGHLAVGAIVTSAILSFTAMFGVWLPNQPIPEEHHEKLHESAVPGDAHGAEQEGREADAEDDHAAAARGGHVAAAELRYAAFQLEGVDEDAFAPVGGFVEPAGEHPTPEPPAYYAGQWYTIAQFGKLKLTIGYYVDALTVTMFCMVTLIASCVHFYALGYMHDELHDPYIDHEVTLSNGKHLERHGRFYRFFQYLSLFSFSMLGLVIAGNIMMVFVFWELVGICSYFLIGFYIERKSASTAANKAFIVNRVGDFGMLIGLMALWASLGTFAFGDAQDAHGETLLNAQGQVESPGIFSQLRTKDNGYALVPTESMVAEEQRPGLIASVVGEDPDAEVHAGQWLLLIAGVGIFCGCVGKSAQFPLHTWLPDAMEGPTPVSALVHSATMVAAGVYLVGRFYPAFTPEALLVIATVGCITLLLAASIAITAVDIKRVLAYSTISQLGYMMLSLGLGGWIAGLFHLITHAFFKSLLFLCSGSVIHAVHTNNMLEMGGLRKKMPITAYTMLVGCLAIAGAGIPLTAIGLSGYYSKDAIIEQAWSYAQTNKGVYWAFLVLPVLGAATTAFYMFRLWFMTFAGKPRNKHRHDHAHESPAVMTNPLLLLAVFAIGVGWTLPFANLSVTGLLKEAQPAGTTATAVGVLMPSLTVPAEQLSHAADVKFWGGLAAFGAAAIGVFLAALLYLWGVLSPEEIKHSFRPLHTLLWNKWWFDEFYDKVFVTPALFLASVVARFDRTVIDGILHAAAATSRGASRVVDLALDRTLVDGSVNTFANWTWDFGLLLRKLQTGSLRQYVLFIVMGTWFMCLAYFAISFVLMSPN
jgi:NADH-quinone oxidoreductase subunit L